MYVLVLRTIWSFESQKKKMKKMKVRRVKRLECYVVVKNQQKTRLTKARNQLADLVDKKGLGLGSLATKTEIRKAVFKVESEFNIIIKLIYNLNEIIAFEDGDEITDIDEIIKALDKEVEELTDIVDIAVKRAKEQYNNC